MAKRTKEEREALQAQGRAAQESIREQTKSLSVYEDQVSKEVSPVTAETAGTAESEGEAEEES